MDEKTASIIPDSQKWCQFLKNAEFLYDEQTDLEHTEKLVEILNAMKPVCSDENLATIGAIQKWLKKMRYTLWKKEDSDSKPIIEGITKLLDTLKDEL